MADYPNGNLVQARPDLDMVAESQDLVEAKNGFIGSQIIPDLPVTTMFGKYPYVDNASWLADPFENVAPMAGLPRIHIEFGKKEFSCEEKGFEMPVNHDLQVLFQDWLDLEKYTAEACRIMSAYHHEASAAAIVANENSYGTSTAVTNQWTSYSNATPIADLKGLVESVGEKCGMDPNTVIMSATTYHNLQQCEEVIERVRWWHDGSGQNDSIRPDELAALIGVKKIVIGKTRKLSVNGSTRTFPRLWGNTTVSVCHTLEGVAGAAMPHWASRVVFAPRTGIKYWQNALGTEGNTTFVSYPDPRIRSEIIQAIEYSQFIVSDKNCAGRLTNIAAS